MKQAGKTEKNIVTVKSELRRVTSEEIKANRNPAYKLLIPIYKFTPK